MKCGVGKMEHYSITNKGTIKLFEYTAKLYNCNKTQREEQDQRKLLQLQQQQQQQKLPIWTEKKKRNRKIIWIQEI